MGLRLITLLPLLFKCFPASGILYVERAGKTLGVLGYGGAGGSLRSSRFDKKAGTLLVLILELRLQVADQGTFFIQNFCVTCTTLFKLLLELFYLRSTGIASLAEFFVEATEELKSVEDVVFDLEVAVLHGLDGVGELADLLQEEVLDPLELPLRVGTLSGQF